MDLDRCIAPELPKLCTFSYFFENQDSEEKIFIRDNVDRFFMFALMFGFMNNMD